jgi:tautomerase-like protein
MPLVHIDLIQGRSGTEIQALRDAVHAPVVDTFEVSERDRYQVLRSHPPNEITALDTGLDIVRSPQLMIVQLVSRRRHREQRAVLRLAGTQPRARLRPRLRRPDRLHQRERRRGLVIRTRPRPVPDRRPRVIQ